MAELLKDNLELERRRCLSEGETSQGLLLQRSARREVPDLLSWLQCFSSFAAVLSSRYPKKARELWAYQATIISEQRRCGGRGWHLYDAMFRQQISSIESMDFSKLNQGLYATTFLAYGGKGQVCKECLSSDYSHDDCALHPSRSMPVVRVREARQASFPEEPRPRGQDRKRGARGACFAWNDGDCTNSYCRYSHVCSRCGNGEHKRPMCRSGLGEPPVKRERFDTRPRR